MSSKENTNDIINAVVVARHNLALIRQWAGKLSYADLNTDILRCYAVLYAFIVIAAAIKDIPKSILERYASLKFWRIVSGFRNFLAHTYDDMPDNRLIDTIHKDLPNLDHILQKILTDIKTST